MIVFIIIYDWKEDAHTFYHYILSGWLGVTKSIIFTKIVGNNY